MDFIPICLKITGKKIVLIGGGAAALHKLIAIKKFATDVTIISREFDPSLLESDFTLIKKEFEMSDLDAYDIIYTCTDDRALNESIAKKCNEIRKPINVTDNPTLSTFVSPATEIIEDIVVSISSDAKSVKKIIKARKLVVEFLKECYENGSL